MRMRCYARGALSLLALIPFLTCRRNHPPDPCSTPGGLPFGYKDTVCWLGSWTDDPDEDELSYCFDWGDGDTSEWTEWTRSGDMAVSSHVWPVTDTYDVRARACDVHAETTGWSEPYPFIVGYPAPVPAVPFGIREGYTETTYTFTTVAHDQEGRDLCYRFNWGTFMSAWTDWTPSDTHVGLSVAWPSPRTFQHHPDTYWIRAQSMNVWGIWSDWSGAHRVTVRPENWPPTRPVKPVGPTEGYANWDTLTYKTYAWDPDGDSLCYRFNWDDGDTSNWTSPLVRNQGWDSMSHLWTRAGHYYVSAQAMDQHGAKSVWSESLEVEIETWEPRRRYGRGDMGGGPRWPTGDVVRSSPAVGPDSTVYIGTCPGYIFAVGANDTIKWVHQMGGAVYCSPAVGPHGIIYCGSVTGELRAIRPNSSLKWRYRTNGEILSSPAVAADGSICFGSANGYVYSIDSTYGEFRWSFATGQPVNSSPAIGPDGTICIGSNDSCLYALTSDGGLKWRYHTGGHVSSSPALGDDGRVYFGSDDLHIYALDTTGALVWRYQTQGQVTSSPAIGPDGTIYCGSDDGCLYALNPDGTLKWKFQTEDRVVSSPAVDADGTVYVGTDDGTLCAFNPDGTGRWYCPVFRDAAVSSSPAIGSRNRVYFGTAVGYLYAVEANARLARTAWPKFRHGIRNTGRREP